MDELNASRSKFSSASQTGVWEFVLNSKSSSTLGLKSSFNTGRVPSELLAESCWSGARMFVVVPLSAPVRDNWLVLISREARLALPWSVPVNVSRGCVADPNVWSSLPVISWALMCRKRESLNLLSNVRRLAGLLPGDKLTDA